MKNKRYMWSELYIKQTISQKALVPETKPDFTFGVGTIDVPFTCQFPMVLHCTGSWQKMHVKNGVFYDLTYLKFCESFRFVPAVFMEKMNVSKLCEKESTCGCIVESKDKWYNLTWINYGLQLSSYETNLQLPWVVIHLEEERSQYIFHFQTRNWKAQDISWEFQSGNSEYNSREKIRNSEVRPGACKNSSVQIVK